jgi:hypothetical protein
LLKGVHLSRLHHDLKLCKLLNTAQPLKQMVLAETLKQRVEVLLKLDCATQISIKVDQSSLKVPEQKRRA